MPKTNSTSSVASGKYELTTTPSARATEAPGASPWTYTNSTSSLQAVCVVGGTVSNIEVSRDEATFDSIQTATGVQVVLAPGDSVRITYTVAPTFSKYSL